MCAVGGYDVPARCGVHSESLRRPKTEAIAERPRCTSHAVSQRRQTGWGSPGAGGGGGAIQCPQYVRTRPLSRAAMRWRRWSKPAGRCIWVTSWNRGATCRPEVWDSVTDTSPRVCTCAGFGLCHSCGVREPMAAPTVLCTVHVGLCARPADAMYRHGMAFTPESPQQLQDIRFAEVASDTMFRTAQRSSHPELIMGSACARTALSVTLPTMCV